MRNIARDDRAPVFVILLAFYGAMTVVVSGVGIAGVALMATAHFIMLVRADQKV